MSSLVQPWNVLCDESISIEAIRSLHTPPSRFRISPSKFPVGTAFPGGSIAGRIYVLSGRCSRTVGDWRVELAPATFADFPAGGYEFQVLGDEAVELVNVYELPELFWKKRDA